MSNREGNEVATVSPLQRLHEPAHTRLSSRYSEVWLPSSTLHQPRCSELAFAEPMTLINCFAKATPPPCDHRPIPSQVRGCAERILSPTCRTLRRIAKQGEDIPCLSTDRVESIPRHASFTPRNSRIAGEATLE